MTAEAYVLQYELGGVRPLCKCGCGEITTWTPIRRFWADYVHGHRAWGRKCSEEAKKKIGAKNSVLMKKYFDDNPEIAKKRSESMVAAMTPEMHAARIQKSNATYASMTAEDKEKFREHTKRIWIDFAEKMYEGKKKAGQTYHERFEAGEYDFTERNEKISASIIKRYQEGGFAWCKGQYTSTKMNRTYNYRSSFEHKYMMILDRDPSVVMWTYETIRVRYELDEINHMYLPDFLVIFDSCKTEIHEVKPSTVCSTPMNVAKFDAGTLHAVDLGWEFRVITEKDISSLYKIFVGDDTLEETALL